MHRVQIIDDGNEFVQVPRPVRHNRIRCYIDNIEVPYVTSAEFTAAVGEVPTFNFETVGRPDIDSLGEVKFHFSPENLSDACLIVSEELEKHGDFYKAFVESVLSVLKEVPDGTEIWLNELAEKIVQRIAGKK